MLTQLIWWSSITLEIAVLVRGLRSNLAYRLPIFYAYIAFVALQDITRLVSFQWSPGVYAGIYWVTEFLGMAMGSLVVFEIYKVSLAAYPGAARMARNALAFVFLTAVAKGLADATSGGWQPASTALQMERALRSVQAAAILALVALFLVYAIRFGRNLRGILLGYGLFIGQRVIVLTFMPPQGHHFWFYAYSAVYVVTLVVWLAYLWSYAPTPLSIAAVSPERDYQTVAAATRRRLQAMRVYVRRAVRS
jgi:hypothetical protein